MRKKTQSTNIVEYLTHECYGMNSADLDFIYSDIHSKIEDILDYLRDYAFNYDVSSNDFKDILKTREYQDVKPRCDLNTTTFLDDFNVRNANFTNDLEDEKSGLSSANKKSVREITTEVYQQYYAYNNNTSMNLFNNNIKPEILKMLRERFYQYFIDNISGYQELMNLRQNVTEHKDVDLPDFSSKIYTTLPVIIEEIFLHVNENLSVNLFEKVKQEIEESRSSKFRSTKADQRRTDRTRNEFYRDIENLLKKWKVKGFSDCRKQLEKDEHDDCLQKLMEKLI